MDSDWQQIYADIEDILFPQLELDPYERMLYYHLLRQTRLKGLPSGLFGVGPLSKALPIGEVKTREILRSMHTKACVRIEDRSRNGHLVHVLLPAEIPSLSRITEVTETINIADLDFYSGRRYLSALLSRENASCFYCLRSLTNETCELDHLIPQVEKVDNSFKNVVVSCHGCNKAKGSLQAAAFLRNLYRSNLLSEEEFQNRLAALELIQSGALIPDLRGQNA